MKIALIGYGKMGKMIEQIALQRGHEIVSIIDINNQEDFASEAFRSADVAIEFTNPMVAYDNYMKAFAAGVKVVSGSTGWLEEHGDEVRSLCTKGGKTLFWSSNFSLGVAVFSAVNKYLAKLMNRFDEYDVSMSETHHIHKLDKPSGTAVKLANDIIENNKNYNSWGLDDYTNNGVLPIESIREGEYFGIHEVKAESSCDIISLRHEAFSREGFATGAVIAAEFIQGKKGIFTMNDLLNC